MRYIPQYVLGQKDPVSYVAFPDARRVPASESLVRLDHVMWFGPEGEEITSHPRAEPIIGKIEVSLDMAWNGDMPDVVRINGVEYRR